MISLASLKKVNSGGRLIISSKENGETSNKLMRELAKRGLPVSCLIRSGPIEGDDELMKHKLLMLDKENFHLFSSDIGKFPIPFITALLLDVRREIKWNGVFVETTALSNLRFHLIGDPSTVRDLTTLIIRSNGCVDPEFTDNAENLVVLSDYLHRKEDLEKALKLMHTGDLLIWSEEMLKNAVERPESNKVPEHGFGVFYKLPFFLPASSCLREKVSQNGGYLLSMPLRSCICISGEVYSDEDRIKIRKLDCLVVSKSFVDESLDLEYIQSIPVTPDIITLPAPSKCQTTCLHVAHVPHGTCNEESVKELLKKLEINCTEDPDRADILIVNNPFEAVPIQCSENGKTVLSEPCLVAMVSAEQHHTCPFWHNPLNLASALINEIQGKQFSIEVTDPALLSFCKLFINSAGGNVIESINNSDEGTSQNVIFILEEPISTSVRKRVKGCNQFFSAKLLTECVESDVLDWKKYTISNSFEATRKRSTTSPEYSSSPKIPRKDLEHTVSRFKIVNLIERELISNFESAKIEEVPSNFQRQFNKESLHDKGFVISYAYLYPSDTKAFLAGCVPISVFSPSIVTGAPTSAQMEAGMKELLGVLVRAIRRVGVHTVVEETQQSPFLATLVAFDGQEHVPVATVQSCGQLHDEIKFDVLSSVVDLALKKSGPLPTAISRPRAAIICHHSKNTTCQFKNFDPQRYHTVCVWRAETEEQIRLWDPPVLVTCTENEVEYKLRADGRSVKIAKEKAELDVTTLRRLMIDHNELARREVVKPVISCDTHAADEPQKTKLTLAADMHCFVENCSLPPTFIIKKDDREWVYHRTMGYNSNRYMFRSRSFLQYKGEQDCDLKSIFVEAIHVKCRYFIAKEKCAFGISVKLIAHLKEQITETGNYVGGTYDLGYCKERSQFYVFNKINSIIVYICKHHGCYKAAANSGLYCNNLFHAN